MVVRNSMGVDNEDLLDPEYTTNTSYNSRTVNGRNSYCEEKKHK